MLHVVLMVGSLTDKIVMTSPGFSPPPIAPPIVPPVVLRLTYFNVYL